MTVDPRVWGMTENRGPCSLDGHVRRLTKDLGLWGYHPLNSIGSQPGWPDWVLIGDGGILFRELKSETGTVSVEQRRVGSMLMRHGLDWSIWRPRDLFSGRIQQELARIA